MGEPRQAPSPPLGILLIGVAAVAWGTTGSVMTVVGRRAAASPLLVGAARLWIAAVLLLILAAGMSAVRSHRHGSKAGHDSSRPRGHRHNGRDLVRWVLAGACMAAYQAAYFTAVTLAGIAVAALVAICSAPLVIAALAPPTLGEALGARVRAALALGVLGTALLVAVPGSRPDLSARFVAGVGLALGAGLAYALYVLVTKQALARTAPLALTAATFTAGAVLITPALLWTDAPLRQLALGWPWLLYLGGVATAGAYALYALGLRGVPASVAGIVTLTEPLTATLLGVLVFGERLGPGGIAGAALLGAALALIVSPARAAGPSRAG